jgi:hypothetical protein
MVFARPVSGTTLMSDQPASCDKGHPYSDASFWMGRVTTMIAPGIFGLWADRRFGTNYLGLIGFLVGLTSGITQIVLRQRSLLRKPGKRSGQGGPNES